MATNEIVAAALEYAGLGYRVFPIAEGGKTPATEHGCLDATSDEAVINAWWRRNPNYNIGVATDGLCVIDVDGKNNPWLREVDRGALWLGAVARTAHGGLHFWFRQNGSELRNTASKIAPQVDTRANGGYVIVWPSLVDGQRYEWIEPLAVRAEDLPPVPEWLYAALELRRRLSESVCEKIPSGQRNVVLTRFAGEFRRVGLTAEEIFRSLSGINDSRCEPPLTPREVRKIADSAQRWESDVVAESLIHDHLSGRDDEPDLSAPPQFPEWCLHNMPWLMRLAFEYGIATAKKPQPELLLGSLIALFGTMFGRKVKDDYDTRTNMMVLGLSPSGTGKEHPRQINKQILIAANLERLSGPERLGSHAGLVTAIHAEPSRLFQLDEIGRLLATMRDAGRNPHLYNIGTVLMQIYSSSNVLWTADAYADVTKVKTINQPCLCVFGTAVPENFYASLTADNLSDGMLARLFVVEGRKSVQRQKPALIGPPHELIEAVKDWFPTGNLLRTLPEADPGVELIEKTPDADQRHEVYTQLVNDKHENEDEVRRAIWSRAPEKSAKLALIHACCDCRTANLRDVRIDLQSVEWGIKLANYSTRLVLHNSSNNVSSSRYEHEKKRLWRHISDRIALNELTRKSQWLKPQDRTAILRDLEESGAISIELEQTGKTSRRLIRRRRSTL